MTSENQEHQNGHASPEIHLRGAEPWNIERAGLQGVGGDRGPPTADEDHDMEDHVEDASSKAEGPKEELDGLLEVCTYVRCDESQCDNVNISDDPDEAEIDGARAGRGRRPPRPRPPVVGRR